jgi:hypothetical protein
MALGSYDYLPLESIAFPNSFPNTVDGLPVSSADVCYSISVQSSGGTSSADEFVEAALAWFGDPDPRIGTAWEKGERLAKFIAHRRTLLVLDGLEPLQ